MVKQLYNVQKIVGHASFFQEKHLMEQAVYNFGGKKNTLLFSKIILGLLELLL